MMSGYGNAIVTTRGYNPQNGRLNTIDARNALNQAVQYNTYGYDLLGNVTLRRDEGSGSASGDSLTYDALNRLTHTDNWTNGVQTVTAVAYDALGYIDPSGHESIVPLTEMTIEDRRWQSALHNTPEPFYTLGSDWSGSGYGVPYSTAEFGEFCFTATSA